MENAASLILSFWCLLAVMVFRIILKKNTFANYRFV